ncbi:MAG: 4Fe-4S binding protein, partial [Candidatus Hodarchaeota archaeon]
FCRTKQALCDAETKVCIALNDKALHLIQEGKAEKIDSKRVLQLLEETWRSGLVHLLRFEEGDPTKKIYLCSCCPCCCIYFKPIEQGKTSHLLKSEYTACVEEDDCVGCALCLEICPFQARNVKAGVDIRNGVGQVDAERCLGCGICAKICPTKATKVQKRNKV